MKKIVFLIFLFINISNINAAEKTLRNNQLDELYDNPPIPLKHKDSYTLLIAVLLSARCTDERVNKITPALFKLADTPQDMILHSPEKIRKIILEDYFYLDSRIKFDKYTDTLLYLAARSENISYCSYRRNCSIWAKT